MSEALTQCGREKSEETRGACFMIEKPALAFNATAVSGEGSVGADDAVAGDDDGDRIGSIGCADGANSVRMADVLSELSIRES